MPSVSRSLFCRFLAAAGVVALVTVGVALGAVPTFAPKASYPAGWRPYDVTVADLNGDGKADLAVTNFNGRSISVLPGQGDGTFGTGTEYPILETPIDVLAADFNGDGRGDLAATAGLSVTVLLADAAGGFGTPIQTTTSGIGYQLASGDVDRDGDVDIVVGSGFVVGASGQIEVLLNDAHGNFPSVTSYPTDGVDTAGLALGDLNRDGNLDAVAGNFSSQDISVLMNQGGGVFGSPTRYALAVGQTREVAVADLNLDKRLDVVVTSDQCQCVFPFLGNGDGTLVEASSLSAFSTTASVAIADVNQDKRPDVITGGLSGMVSVIAAGRRKGQFNPPLPFETTAETTGLSVADLNGDTKLDIVATETFSDTVAVFVNTTS
jgi:FG-GAP-like repeat/FG-GAP repeat